MRLKILVSLMGILAVVLIVLEVQFHYIYWALAPKPKAIPRFLENRTQQDPVEPDVAVEEGTPAENPDETPAEVQAETPAETPTENPDGTPAEAQPEVDKSAS